MSAKDLIISPCAIMLYSPNGNTANEYVCKVLDTPEALSSIGWWLIEFKCPMRDDVKHEDIVLTLQTTAWKGYLRLSDRDRAEQMIRQGLSDLTRETFGIEVSDDIWGTL
ncbi:MAG TPA: hypothetical protein VLH56_19135 [Dissulfurispiraceae bacterium]|nr:hypothetical protein [Dissulfurispiraceae bacterium]